MATDKVTSDMMSGEAVGKKTMNVFISNELSDRRTAYFFDPINKIKTCRINSKVSPLQNSKDLFAKIAVVTHIRSLNLRLVFNFSLCSLLWSIA